MTPAPVITRRWQAALWTSRPIYHRADGKLESSVILTCNAITGFREQRENMRAPHRKTWLGTKRGSFLL